MAYGIGPETNHFIVSITVSITVRDRLRLFYIQKEILTSPWYSSSILSNSFFSQFRNCERDINFSRDGQRIVPMRVPAKVDHTQHLLSLLSWFNSNPTISRLASFSRACAAYSPCLFLRTLSVCACLSFYLFTVRSVCFFPICGRHTRRFHRTCKPKVSYFFSFFSRFLRLFL